MKLAGYDPADLLNYLIEQGYALQEQSSNKEISLEQISDFVKKFQRLEIYRHRGRLR